ncbi:MAG: hypothetical protein H6838_05900 [Planctomycetes bacterium]|nr:hypothetical protein [Planctomycetota bacterium]
MIPRTPHSHPRRWSLLDIDDPDDFYFSCADSGCTACCVDIDTIDEQRQAAHGAPPRRHAHRAPRPRGSS